MRVQFVTLDAGPAGVRQPGTVHEVGEAEGSDLVAGGYAVVIEIAKAVKPGKDKKTGKNDPPASDAPVDPNAPPIDPNAPNPDADA